MTFEKQCTFVLSDIIAVHYECENCHAASVIPIDKIPDPQTLMRISVSECGYCHTEWGFKMNTDEMRAFVDFNSQLKRIATIMGGRNLKLRLEVKCPEQE